MRRRATWFLRRRNPFTLFMGSKPVMLVLVCGVYGFLFWIAYLLMAQPLRYVELFIRRSYRPLGISVTVNDEGKLRRRTRVLGLLLLAFFITHAILVIPGRFQVPSATGTL